MGKKFRTKIRVNKVGKISAGENSGKGILPDLMLLVGGGLPCPL